MKTIWRVLGKVLRWTVIVAVVVAIVVILINSHDENLTPQTLALLKAPPNPYKAGANLFLALAGIHAPSGQSVIAYGKKGVREYEVERAKGPIAVLQYYNKPAAGELKFHGNPTFCYVPWGSIWDEANDHKAEINRTLSANRELYQRYRALRNASGFYFTATPDDGLYVDYTPTPLRCLFLAHFALRMQSGNPTDQASALTDMARDLEVWRLELTGYDSLVAKLLAERALQSDYLVIGHMIADSDTDLSEFQPQIRRLLRQFPASDWKIGRVFGYEFRMFAQGLNSDQAQPNSKRTPAMWETLTREVSAHSFFFHKNATLNLEAENMRKFAEIADPRCQDICRLFC